MKLFPFKRRRRISQEDEAEGDIQSPINLERVGRSQIEDLVSTTRKVPWSLTIAQMLWTAGPVTYLALQGGSMLGYGEPIGVTTYIFFSIYVIIAGIIGIVAKIVADTMRGKRQNRARENITRTIDIIPDLMFAVRDLNLSTLSEYERLREASAILLRKQDLGPVTIAVAVEDLTGDGSLANIAEKIEVFRRAGMFSRIRDLNERNRDHMDAALLQLRGYSSDIAEVLEERLRGIAPSQERGVERGDKFITQIYSAVHHEDLSLMTLSDAEDILGLTFELLSGREITRLIIDYEGDWQLARALDELERCHNDYRQVKAAVVLYLRDLAYFLDRSRMTSLTFDVADRDTKTLLREASQALNELANKLRSDSAAELENRPAARRHLKRALRYAKLTRQAIVKLEDRYVRYVRATERWTMLREWLLEEKSRLYRVEGLRIRESSIALNDEQKLELAAEFCRHLDDHRIECGAEGILRHGESIGIQQAKQLAIRLALILQPLIDLDNPSVQRAVESSRGAYLEGLEMRFSADAKAGLGAAVVKQLRQDLGPAAELIALRLAMLYRMPLSDNIIRFLTETYGANLERLQFIADSAEQWGSETEVPPIPHEPGMIRSYREWQQPIETAVDQLSRLLR